MAGTVCPMHPRRQDNFCDIFMLCELGSVQSDRGVGGDGVPELPMASGLMEVDSAIWTHQI